MATCTNSRPVKRKRVVLSLETKLTILDRNSKGKSQVKLAREYGIGTSTVGDIIKNADKIKSFALTIGTLSTNKKGRKVMRLAKDNQLDEAVFLWFMQRRSQGIPVSGPILCEKAVQLYDQLHTGDSVAPFKASKGWLYRFCSRHGLRQLSFQGEKLSCDATAPEPFKEELLKLMEDESLILEQLQL